MKYLLFPFLLFLFAMNFAQELLGQESDGIIGTWNGTIDVGTTELPLVFHFEAGEEQDTYTGKMDSPAQGAEGIPIDSISYEAGELNLIIGSIGFRFKGRITEENIIEGEISQMGQNMPVMLERGNYEPPTYARPQEPKPPFPYSIEEVKFKNKEADITLAGTLTRPRDVAAPPVVILISGSGPQERDCEVAKHKIFWVLADHLSRNGIAVLRYDDRGVGESEGRFGGATTEDFASDALAAVGFLKKRKDINRKAIGLVGHSEGGLVAPMVANRTKDVSFVVLMAAPGVDGQQILLKQYADIQRASGMEEEVIRPGLQMMEELQDIVIESDDKDIAEELMREKLPEILDKLPDEQREAIPNEEQYMAMQIRAYNNPWMRFFLKYDPIPALKELSCPVLVMNGEKDLQVDAETNLQAIELAFSETANEHVKIRKFPNLNHLFQPAETGSPTEYLKIETTIDQEALNELAETILYFSKLP